MKKIKHDLVIATPIQSNLKILEFLTNNIDYLGSLVTNIKNKFGEPNQITKYEDYEVLVYHFQFDNVKFQVITGDGYGTQYEILDFSFDAILKNKNNINTKIFGFLREFHNEIKK